MIIDVATNLTDLLNKYAIPAVAILFALGAWRLILSTAFSRVGWWPLICAYLLFVATLLASLIVLAGPDTGLFIAFYTFDTALIAVSLIGVPTAAVFVRIKRLGYGMAAVLVVLALLVLAVLTWVNPTNSQEFSLQAFQQSLGELALFVVPAISAFFIGLIGMLRRQQRRDEDIPHQQEILPPS